MILEVSDFFFLFLFLGAVLVPILSLAITISNVYVVFRLLQTIYMLIIY